MKTKEKKSFANNKNVSSINQKKKAFTLIELLAIIVILAIIAVITVPIILNIIENSRRGVAINSAYGYKDAINEYYVGKLIGNSQQQLPNEVKNISELPVDLVVNGEKPTEGWIKFRNGHVIDYSLRIGEYVVNYDETTNSAIAIKSGNIKEQPSETPDNIKIYRKIDGILTEVNKPIEQGDTVEVTGNNTTEKFIVIKTDSSRTLLLAQRNIIKQKVSEEEYIYRQATISETPNYIGFSSENYWTNTDVSPNVLNQDYTDNGKYELGNVEGINVIIDTETNQKASTYVYNNNSRLYEYVEGYKKNLIDNYSMKNITGRLLSKTEADSLSSDVINNGYDYWLGTAWTSGCVDRVRNGSTYLALSGQGAYYTGCGNNQYSIRPVIEISTSNI